MYKYLNKLFLFIAILTLFGCSGSNGGSNQAPTLTLDQVSSVPLINGQVQEFYVYMTNNGNRTLSDLTYAILSESMTVHNQSMISKIKNKLSNIVGHEITTDAILIKDTSECTSIEPQQSCRILVQANTTGVFKLNVSSNNKLLFLNGGSGLVQVDTYTPISTGNLADVLTVTPIGEVNYSNGIGSANFFIINNSSDAVELDTAKLSATLPVNASIVFGNCPNPIPSGNACQVRVVINNPTMTSDQELDIPVNLGGYILNSDSSKTTLPKQNGDSNIHATTRSSAVIQYVFSQSVLLDNSFANLTTVSINEVITNAGSGNLIISNLTTTNDILGIINDSCSGKTLSQGELCQFTVNLDVTKINASGSQQVVIGFTDVGLVNTKSVNSNINWTYIPPLPLAAPSLNMSVGSNSLNQESLTTTLVMTNMGNVPLSNISTPSMAQNNPRVVLTNDNVNQCTGSLDVGASCTYNITYNPVAPSETTSVVFSGVSALHPDNRGSTINTNFNNSVSVNLSSTFEGVLSSNDNVALDESTTSGSITFTNTGNYIATISNVAFGAGSSTNLNITGGTCQQSTILNPNQSCTVTVGRVTEASGSGNGVMVITYDNHNGTSNASSSNSNIEWLIGNAPSLYVVFSSNNLTTPITVESAVRVTLTNNGRDTLTNIIVPTLSAPLSYTSGTANGCAIDGSQSLAIGESCSLFLTYNPSTAQATSSESLPSFSATYMNVGVTTSYTTNLHAVTLTALALGNLSFNPTLVSQAVNWVNNTETSEVVITNVGGISTTITNIVSNNNQITTNGCANGTLLAMGESCSLSVIGNYGILASNMAINSILDISYSDASGSGSTSLNISANYTAMLVVTPGLTVNSSLFNSNVSLGVNESASYVVALTNTTTKINNGIESISIPYSSLMPSSDSSATYSINTVGIINNPCSLPSSGNSMILAAGVTCNYHLVIHAANSEAISSSKAITTNYDYNSYSANSIAPSWASAPIIDNSFNLAVIFKAQLNIAVVNGQGNNFNAIERGLMPTPTVGLTITNTGTGAVNGSVTPNLPSGITGDFSSCNNLVAGGVCNVILTMSTANVITAANLNTRTINYNNGINTAIANFSSIPYSVIAPLTPAISMVATVTNCVVGNGTGSACMSNPDDKGGSASSIKVRLMFTNTSPITSASSISLPITESNLFATAAYTLSSNTCNNGVSSNGGSCYMEYSVSTLASSSAINPDISASTFNYNYAYITAQGQSLNNSSTSSLNINIDIVNPVLTLSSINNIAQSGSGNVSITVSNMYQTMPTLSLNVENPNGGSATDISTTSVSCNTLSAGGAVCSSSIITTQSTPAVNGYKAFVISSISITSNINTFDVYVPPIKYMFVSNSFGSSYKYNGNLGGVSGADSKCAQVASANSLSGTYKAMIADGSNRVACSTANCTGAGNQQINWVLQANTLYKRLDNTSIGLTNAQAVFNFPLQNSISATADSIWSGLSYNWTSAASSNCANWSNSSDGNASRGAAATNSMFAIGGDSAACSWVIGLYCVQQ